MSRNFYETLGIKLKSYRKAQNLTLAELSEKIHKSIATVSKYENGSISIPIDVLVDICTVLNVDITTLLPATYKDDNNVDILKYENYFIDILYVYWYNGETHKVKNAVIENSNLSMNSTIHFGIRPGQDVYQSEYTYNGIVSYSDTSVTFFYTNIEPPFDKLFIRTPLLFPRDHQYNTGIMSCISYFYQGVTTKVLISKTPLTITDEIKDSLIISPEEIKELKRTNMLIVK